MVQAKSRLVLMLAMGYMVLQRIVILTAEMADKGWLLWIVDHRSILILPTYLLLAIAFGMTYYELRNFHFTVPLNEEDMDTQKRHEGLMKSLSKPMDKE